MLSSIRNILIYAGTVIAVSVAYYVYAYNKFPAPEERETYITEVGEAFGEFALWIMVFLYARTVLKILMGKGKVSKRLLPAYKAPESMKSLNGLLSFLNRTHVYFGIAAVAVILLHIVLVGMPMQILFFPAVLALVIWQALFGLFLSWRYSPQELRKFSYLVHAQFVTGIMIGIFAWFGHLLVDA